ncbi:MAG: hypothetical protein SVR08_00365 [Spirochaetota bacterium]|nr:hypothetical protein [Spirochaetota bacterium]
MRNFILKTVVMLIFFIIISTIVTCKDNKLSTTQIIGEWTTESGADWEFMNIDEENNFFTYLNNRPYSVGKWKLDNNTLVIIDGGEQTVKYTVKITSDLKMVFTLKNGELFVFKPYKEKGLDELLLNARAYFHGIVKYTGLESTEIIKEEGDWNTERGMLKLRGYSTFLSSNEKMNFEIINQKNKEICEYLKGLGFKDDVYNTSEIISGLISASYYFKIKIKGQEGITIWCGSK